MVKLGALQDEGCPTVLLIQTQRGAQHGPGYERAACQQHDQVHDPGHHDLHEPGEPLHRRQAQSRLWQEFGDGNQICDLSGESPAFKQRRASNGAGSLQ